MTEPTTMKVPVTSKHRVKVISSNNPDVLEKETNAFLDTISEERLLMSLTFLATGEIMNNVIYYRDLSPMTEEEWAKKEERQTKFSSGFIPKNLMPNTPEVTKL